MPLPFSGIIPSNELSLEERRRHRTDALAAVEHRAINVKRIGAGPEEIVLRDIIPDIDLGLANRWFRTGALVAATINTYVNVALAVQRCLVIYGVSVESPTLDCSFIYFRSGPAGATTRGIANLEYLNVRLETMGYLSKCVLWDPQETVFIQLWPRLTNALGDRVILHGAIAEPVGETVSGPVF